MSSARGDGLELFQSRSIIGGVAFGYWLDPHFGTRSLIGLSIGTLIGGVWQLSAQFPSLRRVGYKYIPIFAGAIKACELCSP